VTFATGRVGVIGDCQKSFMHNSRLHLAARRGTADVLDLELPISRLLLSSL